MENAALAVFAEERKTVGGIIGRLIVVFIILAFFLLPGLAYAVSSTAGVGFTAVTGIVSLYFL